MTRSLVGLAAVVVVAATVSADAAPQARALRQPPTVPPRELVLFGHIKALTRTGGHFELRFDPALYLSGETANRAAIEDKVIPPGDVVPNDHYIREEGHKLLTFVVPPGAHVSVVTNSGKGIAATAISVAELAEIVRGRNPRHRHLFEPKNGFWVRVAIDTVRSLDQQYSP